MKFSNSKSIEDVDFKIHCLQLIEQAQKQRSSLAITRQGKPIAKLIPILDQDHFGFLKDVITINSDITPQIDIDWESQ